MKDENTQPEISERLDDQIKLYTILVDQYMNYHAAIWQIPTALIVANFLTIEKFITNSIFLSALAVFNLGMILVVHRLIKQQGSIMVAKEKLEDKLRVVFGDSVPRFRKHKIPARHVMVFILSLLELVLLAYIATLIT